MTSNEPDSIKAQVTKVNSYEKLEPMVNENGIYLPEPMTQPSGRAHTYKLVMTRDQFMKAYRLYILEDVRKMIEEIINEPES